MRLDQAKKIYMIGIKGVGMTMLAQFLKSRGNEVLGSDTDDVFMTDQVLKENDIKFFEKFDENNIPDNVDLIIYSTAYNESNNPEMKKAKIANKSTLSYAEALGEIFREQYGIAVVGSHGKTTTSAWLSYVMEKSEKSPSAMIGSRVPQLGGSSLYGKSDFLIIEADEYQNKLKYFDPKAVLLNNIDYDHPDFFPNREEYRNVFIEFIKKIPKKGFLVANFDDKEIKKYAGVNCRAKTISYAIDEAADYAAYDIKKEKGRQYFKVKINSGDEGGEFQDMNLGDFVIQLPGRHNVYNALAVIAASVELGVELHEIRTHLENFLGTDRRMQILGSFIGAIVIDDYAHHPTEIRTTIKGAKDLYPGRKLRVVFHPHTFTRTKALFKDFVKSFNDADELVVLDIYGSAREKQGGVHSRDLVKEIKKNKDEKSVRYIPTLEKAENYLRNTAGPNDVILLMGAGDVFRIGENMLK